jgi:hypothetical protein
MELERRINSSIKYVRATYVLVSQIFRAYSTILLVILIRMQSKNLELAKYATIEKIIWNCALFSEVQDLDSKSKDIIWERSDRNRASLLSSRSVYIFIPKIRLVRSPPLPISWLLLEASSKRKKTVKIQNSFCGIQV